MTILQSGPGKFRPPLSEKSFPVHQKSQSVGRDFFVFILIFLLTRIYRKYKREKNFFQKKKRKKKFQSALLRPVAQWTGNNFLFKGGLRADAMLRSGRLLHVGGRFALSQCGFMMSTTGHVLPYMVNTEVGLGGGG